VANLGFTGDDRNIQVVPKVNYAFVDFSTSDIAQSVLEATENEPIIFEGTTLSVEERNTSTTGRSRGGRPRGRGRGYGLSRGGQR